MTATPLYVQAAACGARRVATPLKHVQNSAVSESVSAIGRYGLPGWLRAGFPILAAAAWAAVAAGSGHMIFAAVYLTVLAVTYVVIPPTLIDHTGARVSARRYPFRRLIRWEDVTAVIVSGPHEADERIGLRLTGGSVVTLRHVPRSRGPGIAELACTTLTRGYTPPRAAPPATPRYPTPAQQDQDLAARTARLARQNDELRSALSNLRHTTASNTRTPDKQ